MFRPFSQWGWPMIWIDEMATVLSTGSELPSPVPKLGSTPGAGAPARGAPRTLSRKPPPLAGPPPGAGVVGVSAGGRDVCRMIIWIFEASTP